MVQSLGSWRNFIAKNPGLTPGQETEVPRQVWQKKKKKERIAIPPPHVYYFSHLYLSVLTQGCLFYSKYNYTIYITMQDI